MILQVTIVFIEYSTSTPSRSIIAAWEILVQLLHHMLNSIYVPKQKKLVSRNKESCPWQNKCLTPKVNYETKVPNNAGDEKHVYLSASDTTPLMSNIALIHRISFMSAILNVQNHWNIFLSVKTK